MFFKRGKEDKIQNDLREKSKKAKQQQEVTDKALENLSDLLKGVLSKGQASDVE